MFSGAKSTIGNVPLVMSDASGSWRVHNGDLTVDGALIVSDRDANPRFYPLQQRQRAFHAGRRLCPRDRHAAPPGERARCVTDVALEHRLSSGAGHATLDVPGLRSARTSSPTS